MAEEVRYAVSGEVCPGTRHGNRLAYMKYRCKCPDATEGYRLYRKRLRYGVQPAGLVDPRGSRRKVRALQAIGWAMPEIARRVGSRYGAAKIFGPARITRQLADKIDVVYRELCMTPGPSRKMRQIAAARGFVPPMGWDDIDNDDDPADAAERDTVPDTEVVYRLVAGKQVPARTVDRVEAVRVMRLAGDGSGTIATRLHMSTVRVTQILGRLGLPQQGTKSANTTNDMTDKAAA